MLKSTTCYGSCKSDPIYTPYAIWILDRGASSRNYVRVDITEM